MFPINPGFFLAPELLPEPADIREDLGSVTRLTLNSPERLNALSDEMLADLTNMLDELGQDRAVKAVIIAGQGKAFCAGHDLKQMQAKRKADDGGAAALKDLFDR